MSADLRPATDVLTRLVGTLSDEDLTRVTPCAGITVGALLDHVDTLCTAFTAAAGKTGGNGPAPVPDAARLGADWRDRIPARLAGLTQAWGSEAAWTGMTEAGGNLMPATDAGSAALDEVIVHGWDLAAATGVAYPLDDAALTESMQTAYAWVQRIVEQMPMGSPGLFGPPVAVPGDAPLLHRLLGLTGRRPDWRPAD